MLGYRHCFQNFDGDKLVGTRSRKPIQPSLVFVFRYSVPTPVTALNQKMNIVAQHGRVKDASKLIIHPSLSLLDDL